MHIVPAECGGGGSDCPTAELAATAKIEIAAMPRTLVISKFLRII
jgi:hypothetical protein